MRLKVNVISRKKDGRWSSSSFFCHSHKKFNNVILPDCYCSAHKIDFFSSVLKCQFLLVFCSFCEICTKLEAFYFCRTFLFHFVKRTFIRLENYDVQNRICGLRVLCAKPASSMTRII